MSEPYSVPGDPETGAWKRRGAVALSFTGKALKFGAKAGKFVALQLWDMVSSVVLPAVTGTLRWAFSPRRSKPVRYAMGGLMAAGLIKAAVSASDIDFSPSPATPAPPPSAMPDPVSAFFSSLSVPSFDPQFDPALLLKKFTVSLGPTRPVAGNEPYPGWKFQQVLRSIEGRGLNQSGSDAQYEYQYLPKWWPGVLKMCVPEAAQGLNAAQILQLRDDETPYIASLGAYSPHAARVELKQRVFWCHVNKNETYFMEKMGRPPQDRERYLMWQQGAGGATKLLANPHANAAATVGGGAVTQNAGKLHQTSGEFANFWLQVYDRKERAFEEKQRQNGWASGYRL